MRYREKDPGCCEENVLAVDSGSAYEVKQSHNEENRVETRC